MLLRRCPWLVLPVALMATAFLLARGSRAFAEGEKPGNPPDSGAGMDGAEPGMDGAEPGMDAEPKGDGDEEDSDTPVATQEKVQRAVDRGVKWLKQRQLPDGSWGLVEGNAAYGGGNTGTAYKHPAGATALALYTLLKCKEPVTDPVVMKGFKYLRDKQKQPGGAYETSMMLLAVTAVADPFKKVKASEAQGDKVKFPAGDWRDWAQKLHDNLLAKRAKAKMLGWRYMVEGNVATPPGGNEDLSSTQLAVLSLLAAERCGIKTDSKVWNDVIGYSMKQQADDGPEWDRSVYDRKKGPDGAKASPGGSDPEKGRYAPPPGAKPTKDKARGFAYIKSDKLSADEGQPTGGMTACGIGNIMVARYVLSKREDKAWANRDQKAVQQSIYDGCAWLDANWLTYGNPGKQSENVYHIYHMYCCERAFDLIGNNLLGKHYWYNDFAGELVARQHEKGFWNSNSTHKPEEVLDTCFALLVLKRSTKGGIPYGSITGGGDEPPEDNRGK